MTTLSDTPLTSLFDRLDNIGLKKTYVRARLLPSWWDDEVASTPAGFAELAMLLARRARIPVSALLDKGAALSHLPGGDVSFKAPAGTNLSNLTLAQNLAIQVARSSIPGLRVALRAVPSADEVRSTMLAKGLPWVGFGDLLDYCWTELGIPVLPISNFPTGIIKMDGLAANIDGRAVIVISNQHLQAAWLLFILAHEIGHVASGHVGLNKTLVDSDIDREGQDAEETQANAYATLLLRGENGKTLPKHTMNGETLLDRAKSQARGNRIDPGHLILSYAKEKKGKFWPVANRALGLLDPGANAPQIMRDKMVEHLDWSAFSDDVTEYIRRMTGLDPA